VRAKKSSIRRQKYQLKRLKTASLAPKLYPPIASPGPESSKIHDVYFLDARPIADYIF